MLEQKPAPEEIREDGEVVYRRISPGAGDGDREAERRKRRKSSLMAHLAPTQKTVIAGFALLLLLVLLLGYLSVRKMNEVGAKILNDEKRHAAIRNSTLELRIAATNLDNEARARARYQENPQAIRPPFDMRLNGARDEVEKLMHQFVLPPSSQNEKWRSLSAHLTSFIQVTKDDELYRLEGFPKFQAIDKDFNELLEGIRQEQEEISKSNEELQRSAARRIWLLTAAALLLGALVAAYTIWEMQRRFRQVRGSMEEARREREFSTQMLEGMVSAVAAIDSHDRIRSANGAFFKIFRQARIGASIHDKFAAPAVMKMLEAATSSRVVSAKYRGRWVCDENTPGCTDKTFDVYSSPLTIDGEQGQIVTLVDVTEAAEAESVMRRTEALTAMGQAVAQVAHEIKNPLGSIRLGVSMLRDTSTDDESQSTIDLVERGINHLNKLVVDVTQFSRQRPLELSEVELNLLVDSSLELVADVIQEKHARIERHFSNENLRGLWDADQMRQVFVNLIANAIDASREGMPVTISTERAFVERKDSREGNGNRTTGGQHGVARVTVEDQGVGMDDRTRTHLFEPFFTTKKRGTGLGLAIVKQIVEQHGGTISVESSPGKGTRFTVDLPMRV